MRITKPAASFIVALIFGLGVTAAVVAVHFFG